MAFNKQFLISTHAGSEALAVEALTRLVSLSPNGAEVLNEIETKLVNRFKNSEIPAGHEMKMVEVVGPAIDEIKRLIKEAKAAT